MKKNTDLKSYLHLWKDHFSADVEGQSSETQHLDEGKLRQMVEPGGISEASPEDLDHLSTCPVCLEEWSLLCTLPSGEKKRDSLEPLPISYGIFEDDVTGQSGNLILKSTCKTFTLSIHPAQNDSNHGIISLKVSDPALDNIIIQVRDRNGLIITEGKVEKGELLTDVSLLNSFDLTIWTVLKKSSV